MINEVKILPEDYKSKWDLALEVARLDSKEVEEDFLKTFPDENVEITRKQFIDFFLNHVSEVNTTEIEYIKKNWEWVESGGDYSVFDDMIEENLTGAGETYSSPKIFKRKMKEVVNKPSGRRYIPKEFMLPKEFRGEYFRLAKKKDEYVLLANPAVKFALDSIERGRTSFEKEQKLSALTRFLKEKLPSGVRAAIKSGLKFAKIDKANNTFFPVDVTINRVDEEGNIYIKNPSQDDSDPIQPKLYEKMNEQLKKLIEKEILNEVTYNQFRNEVKHRTRSEALHKAIKEVKKKIQEVDRIVDYTSRMKQELNEDGGLNYWKASQKYVGQIAEMVNHLNNKLKTLNQ